MSQKYDIIWLNEKVKNDIPLKFIFFWGKNNKYNEDIGNFCFSQWFESKFVVDDIVYRTAEHWMMANKAKLFNDSINFDKIINSKSPKEAREFGRQVKGFNAEIWDFNKSEIVKYGNVQKFSQNKKLGDYLLSTKNKILVEASPIDIIWGIGLSKESVDRENVSAWRGLNLLGFILMEVRDLLLDNEKKYSK